MGVWFGRKSDNDLINVGGYWLKVTILVGAVEDAITVITGHNDTTLICCLAPGHLVTRNEET